MEELKKTFTLWLDGQVTREFLAEMIETRIVNDECGVEEAGFLGTILEDLQKDPSQGSSESMLLADRFFNYFKTEDFVMPTQNLNTKTACNEIMLKVSELEVLDSFVLESREHLENLENRVLSLELTQDVKLINDIFRSMHTIKGMSSFLGLEEIKNLSHALESLLDGVRSERLPFSTDIIDVLLNGRDQLMGMVNDIAHSMENLEHLQGEAEITIHEFCIEEFIDSILGLIQAGGVWNNQMAPEPKKATQNPLPSAQDQAAFYDTLINPEMQKKFIEETVDLLDGVEKAFLSLEKAPEGESRELINESFRLIHTIKGNAGFFGFLALERTCMEAESLLDEVRKNHNSLNEAVMAKLWSYLDQIRDVQNKGDFQAELKQDSESKEIDPGDSWDNSRQIQESSEAIRKLATGPEISPRNDESAPGENLEKYSVKRKDIRVDTGKLDQLFDLIGELITAEAMVLDNPEIKNLELESFNKAAVYLSKITREIQAITMSIRMIPLEGLFSKMTRLVRDLSRKFNKKINFRISGQETEMDRNIIEEISDPLVHIIRNAVDHGIESAEKRLADSKDPVGTINLSAKYEGNEIWIIIKDDGGGLNRDRIVSKALERGLVRDEENLTDSQVWNLIFEPGFSTAAEVSEISGRGVGMDVVKKNIEKLRGTIDVQSEAGKGTLLILKIPLTLAIIDGITLKAGGTMFTLAIADVAEFQNLDKTKITQTSVGMLVYRLRSEIIPLIRLSDFFQLDNQSQENREVVIIIKSQDRKMALIIDEILGYRQVVLKPLPEYLGNMKALSGCSVLGNGDVSLILDINALFGLVE